MTSASPSSARHRCAVAQCTPHCFLKRVGRLAAHSPAQASTVHSPTAAIRRWLLLTQILRWLGIARLAPQCPKSAGAWACQTCRRPAAAHRPGGAGQVLQAVTHRVRPTHHGCAQKVDNRRALLRAALAQSPGRKHLPTPGSTGMPSNRGSP